MINAQEEYFTKKEHIPVDDTGTSLTEIDGEKTILTNRGGESSGKYYYFYPPFKDYETSSSMEYISNGTNRNYLKHYLGDDCSGFVQGIIYTLSDGDRGQSGNNPNVMSDTTGLWNHNVSANNLVTGEYDTDNAMLKLGWEKYYLGSDNKWNRKRRVKISDNNYVVEDGELNNSMSISFLLPGDILVTKGDIFSDEATLILENSKHLQGKGHAEVYIGYKYPSKKYIIESDEQSGIKELGNRLPVNGSSQTFGWGQVKYKFPTIISFKYADESNCFKLLHKNDGSDYDTRKYTVIWRKNQWAHIKRF